MNKKLDAKRLVKRHNRHASDAAKRVKISVPDVRTPEQVQAARDVSRPVKLRTGKAAHV